MSVIWDFDGVNFQYHCDEPCKCTFCGHFPHKLPFWAWRSPDTSIVMCNACIHKNIKGMVRDFVEITMPQYFRKKPKQHSHYVGLMKWWEDCVIFNPHSSSSSGDIQSCYEEWACKEYSDDDEEYAHLHSFRDIDGWEFLTIMGCESYKNGWRNITIRHDNDADE